MSDSSRKLAQASPVVPPAPPEIKTNELTHPEWPVWSCTLTPIRELDKPVTVGEKLLLKCEGSTIKPIENLPSFLFPQDTMKYSLHPLEIRKSDSNLLELIVTGYQPAAIDYDWIEIEDGDTGFRIEKFSNQVQSVIPEGQQVEPVVNVPLQYMPYPIWMWAGLLLAVLLPSLFIVLRLRRRNQIAALVDRLSISGSALRPYDQFSKDMRALVRNYNYHAQPALAPRFVSELNELFKTYLTRAFRLPALVWGPGTFVSEIKRKHKKTYKDILSDLKNTMVELNKTESSGKASPEDADQLKKLSMVLSERIYKIQEDKANR